MTRSKDYAFKTKIVNLFDEIIDECTDWPTKIGVNVFYRDVNGSISDNIYSKLSAKIYTYIYENKPHMYKIIFYDKKNNEKILSVIYKKDPTLVSSTSTHSYQCIHFISPLYSNLAVIKQYIHPIIPSLDGKHIYRTDTDHWFPSQLRLHDDIINALFKNTNNNTIDVIKPDTLKNNNLW